MLGRVSWRRWALTALLAAALVAVAIPALRPAAGRALRPAPALPRALLSGPRVSLTSLRGRPVVVNFWARWCDGCTREALQLERFSQLAPEHAVVVGVDLDDTPGAAMAFVRRFGLTYSIVRASDDGISARVHRCSQSSVPSAGATLVAPCPPISRTCATPSIVSRCGEL